MAQATLVTLDTTHARVVITPSYTGADTTVAVIVQRTEDGGVSWTNVRADLADGVLSMLGGTSRQFPDYEAPFDIPFQYRTIKSDAEGNAIGTTFNLSAILVMPSSGSCSWWVHPVDNPTVIASVIPTSDDGATFGAARGIQYGVNAQYPNVQLGARQARSAAAFSVLARTNAEASRIITALGDSAVLCVRSPATHGWARRFIVVSNITEVHPTPIYGGGWVYRAAYVEVARPTVPLLVYGATYDQLAAAFATYAALQAGFGTFNDQTLGLV